MDRDYFIKIDKAKIDELLALIKPHLRYRNEMYKRYIRKEKPTGIMGDEQKNVSIPYEYYSVTIAQGYLAGKAPAYKVRDDKNDPEYAELYQKKLDYIRRYNDDGATFSKLIHDFVIMSGAILYIHEDKNNEIVYNKKNPSTSMVVHDFNDPPYPIGLINITKKKKPRNKEYTEIEIITGSSRRIFNENGEPIPFEDFDETGKITTMTEKLLYWDDVPVISFNHPDNLAIFEPALKLIDFFENAMTNLKNMTQYNDNAKLMIRGYQPEHSPFIPVVDKDGNMTGEKERNPAHEREVEELYKSLAIFLNQEFGDVSWLLKDVSYAGILDMLRYIHEQIVMIVGTPNMTDDSFGAASGISLRFKLFVLEQYGNIVEREFKEGYLRNWEIITNRLNLKNNTNFDFRDIDINFPRNIPSDRFENIDIAIKGYQQGIISQETAISESGFEVDAASEIARIAGEKQQIKGIKDIVSLYMEELIDKETAISLLPFDEETVKKILDNLDEKKQEEQTGNNNIFPFAGQTQNNNMQNEVGDEGF